MTETVGLIGLGNMGAPIAMNLMRGGYEVRVYNRTAAKAQPLIEQGAKLAAQAGDVAVRGGVVFSIVADDHALDEVCMAKPSFVERLGQGGVHVSMSTVSPAISRRLAAHHAEYGVSY